MTLEERQDEFARMNPYWAGEGMYYTEEVCTVCEDVFLVHDPLLDEPFCPPCENSGILSSFTWRPRV